MWVSEVEVPVMFDQSVSQALLPSFFLYSQRVRVTLPPVTEEDTVSLPVPAPATAVGFAGFAGRVGNAVAVTSSVEQALSLYALKVWEVFAVRPDTVAVVPVCSDEHVPLLGVVYL